MSSSYLAGAIADVVVIAMDGVRAFTSQFNRLSDNTRMLDCLEDFMAFRKITYARLDGSTARPRRTLDIRLVCSGTPCCFNSFSLAASVRSFSRRSLVSEFRIVWFYSLYSMFPAYKVFLVSTKAGGLGA